MNKTMHQSLAMFAATLAILAGCTSNPPAPQQMPREPLGFTMGPYHVSAMRNGCNVFGARIKSTVTLGNTYHQLMVTSQGNTVALFAINCLPVLAGGEAQCLVLSENPAPPSAVAGPHCGAWSNYILTRR